MPLFASLAIDEATIADMPTVIAAVNDALDSRRHVRRLIPSLVEPGHDGTRLLAVADGERLADILRRVLDESQFPSDHGVRSLSRKHRDEPYRFDVGGERHEVRYLPGVSDNRVFGGNSNWRGRSFRRCMAWRGAGSSTYR